MSTAITSETGASAAGSLGTPTGVYINVYAEHKNGVFVPGKVIAYDPATGKFFSGGATGVTVAADGHAQIQAADAAGAVGTVDLWEVGGTNQGFAAVSFPTVSTAKLVVVGGYVNVVS